MTSQPQQNKAPQHRNSPMEGYCEDYNGYSAQHSPKERTSPQDILLRNQQAKQSQPEDKYKAAEHNRTQGDRADSLEYVQWQDKKVTLHYEASPSNNYPKGLFDGIGGSNKANGSLESISGDMKSTRDKLQLPTFGEDQFNTIVAQQQSNSPSNKRSNPNMSKIDQMLEQHRQRKALQKFYELENEAAAISPIPEKIMASRDSDNIPRLFKDQDLRADAVEPGWREAGHSRERQSFGAQSFGVEGSRHGSNPSGQYERKGLVDLMSETNSSAEETGRFKWSPRWNEEANKMNSNRETNRDTNRETHRETNRDTNREIIEEKSNPPSQNATPEIKSNRSSSRNMNADNSSLRSSKGKNLNANNVNTNVPQISENSKRIFKNSQRAKEDEQMMQELLANKIRQLSNTEMRDAYQLQRIPEENEESLEKSKLSHNGSPKSKTKFSQLDTEESREKGVWSLGAEGIMAENLGQRSRITPETQVSRLTLSEDSPKRLINNESPSFSYVVPAVTTAIKGTTVVEHKKLSNPLSYRKDENTGREVSPNRQEIKQMVKAPKQIYLKMVDNTVNPLNSKDSSPRRKTTNSPRKSAKNTQEPSSPVSPVKAVQKNNKVHDKISPEELEKYDEVQRLEVILSNLQHIQRSNLLAQIHALRMKSGKSGDYKIPVQVEEDWSQYALDINNDAMDIRSSRKNRSIEKMPRMVKSASPKRMEKIDVSAESYANSAQLRQQLAMRNEGDEDVNSVRNIWRHENGLKKHWENDNLYDRNQKWLMVRKYKLDQLNENLSTQEMKDCSFKPVFFTKNQSSLLSSPQRSCTETSNGNINSLSERLPIAIPKEQNTGDLQAVVSDRNISDRKSLYKERKNQESYTGLFDLKKTYNLYKNDSLLSKRSEGLNSIMGRASDARQKDFVN